MHSVPHITRVRFVPARRLGNNDGGLLGWVSFQIDGGLLIDGVALRRSLDDRLVFSWPARKDRAGQLHHHVRPLDDASRETVEGQLLGELRRLVGVGGGL